VEKEIAKRFDVNGYPTIKFWLKGQDKPTDYDGERDAEGLFTNFYKTELKYFMFRHFVLA
jgi:hypothetical protein